nr:isochorismatase family protein [Photorhabdus cinerea]
MFLLSDFMGLSMVTDLEDVFKAYGVTEVVLTGQHIHCCVRHTAYGAFIRGYRIKVSSDAVSVFPGVDQEAALDYLKTIYGAEITTSTALGVLIRIIYL